MFAESTAGATGAGGTANSLDVENNKRRTKERSMPESKRAVADGFALKCASLTGRASEDAMLTQHLSFQTLPYVDETVLSEGAWLLTTFEMITPCLVRAMLVSSKMAPFRPEKLFFSVYGL